MSLESPRGRTAELTHVSIIGFGPMGEVLADTLPPDVTVTAFDTAARRSSLDSAVTMVPFDTAARADLVILATPPQSFSLVTRALRSKLRRETTVMQVASVQGQPQQLFAKNLSRRQPQVHIHPLFGPQSAADGNFAGKHAVLTNDRESVGQYGNALLEYWSNKLGIGVHTMQAYEHDSKMAQVQALPFFLGRALNEAGVDAAVHPKELRSILEVESNHSAALHETLQSTEHAHRIRLESLAVAARIHRQLDGESMPLPIFIGKIAAQVLMSRATIEPVLHTASHEHLNRLVQQASEYVLGQRLYSMDFAGPSERKAFLHAAELVHNQL